MQAPQLILFVARYNQALRNHESFFYFPYFLKITNLLHCFERNYLVQCYTTLKTSVLPEVLFASRRIKKTQEIYLLKIYPLYYSNYSLYSQLSLKSSKKQLFPISAHTITTARRTFKNYFSPLLIIFDCGFYVTQNDVHKILERQKKPYGGILFAIFYRFSGTC